MHSKIIVFHSFSLPTPPSSPCTSHQRSLSGVKDLALGVSGGGPSISEPRVLRKKEELREESLTTGLCSLCSDPTTSGSQATMHSHIEPCYRLCDGGDGQPPLRIQAELRDAIEGLRMPETPLWTSAHLWIQLCPLIRSDNVDLCFFNWAGAEGRKGGTHVLHTGGAAWSCCSPVCLATEQH